MATTYTLSERHFPEDLLAGAEAADADPEEHFESLLENIVAGFTPVDSKAEALAYAVHEVASGGEALDATDSGVGTETTDSGQFDLRKRTKID